LVEEDAPPLPAILCY